MVQRANEMVRKIPIFFKNTLKLFPPLMFTAETFSSSCLQRTILVQPFWSWSTLEVVLEAKPFISIFSIFTIFIKRKAIAQINALAIVHHVFFDLVPNAFNFEKIESSALMISDLTREADFSTEKLLPNKDTGLRWTLTVWEGTSWWKNVSATWRVETKSPWLTLISSTTSKLGELE